MKRKMRLKFYVDRIQCFRKGIRKEYRWRLTAPNGRIVLASTEGYSSKWAAKRNWERIRDITIMKLYEEVE